MSHLHLLVMLISYAFTHSLSAEDSLPINPMGQWINEDRSRIEIDRYHSENGRIEGTYYSSSGTDGEGHPLIGWYNPNKGTQRNHSPVISFTVHWGDIGSITSWTGYIYKHEGQTSMYTLWHLARSRETHSWERLLTRSSTFTLMR